MRAPALLSGWHPVLAGLVAALLLLGWGLLLSPGLAAVVAGSMFTVAVSSGRMNLSASWASSSSACTP